MSLMDFETSRYFPQHSLSYPNYYYNDQNVPLAVAYATRADTHGYNFGGPVRSPSDRDGMGRSDLPPEPGPSRRRVAMACARCRKRKIRCSGELSNGLGCNSCRAAGVEASQCQFNRVGSDQLHKVIDNLNMARSLTGLANSNGMMPIYTAAPQTPLYPRSVDIHQFSPLDTKSAYTAWSVPYGGDTSPVETYGLETNATYPTGGPLATSANTYGSSYRWTHPASKPLHHGLSNCYEHGLSYSTNGLPYVQTENLRTTATSEAHSPLNMSSLRLTLPERPRPQNYPMSEGATTQRQLPIPQPSPAQTSRNVVDRLQDQRLRSARPSTGPTYSRPLLPWSLDSDNLVTMAQATSIETSTQPATTTDGNLTYLTTTTTTTGGKAKPASTAPFQLNFTAPALLEAIHAPAPAPTYSTFRESRSVEPSSAQMARQSSQTSLYNFSTDIASKCHSQSNRISDDCKLVSGHEYQPLAPYQNMASSTAANMQRESFEHRNNPLHRSSISNINNTF